MKAKLLYFFIGLFMLVGRTPLYSEIEQATLYWTAEACDDKCARFLERQLKAISGVREVKIFSSGGTAELFWKPRAAFSYQSVLLAMKRIGLGLRETKVKLRGTITHVGNKFYITSLGDSTKFEILSPALQDETQYVERHNVQTHLIREPLRSQLMDAQKNHRLVTIQGPLFQPHRPGDYIIAGSVSVQ